MHLPGTASLLFLAYLLVFLPWAAFRSARRLGVAADGTTARPRPSREAVWISTMMSLVVLLVLAWLTGRGFDYPIFAMPTVGTRELLVAALALALCFGLRGVARALRSQDERRRMTVFRLAPRSAREWVFWAIMVLAAGIAEEAAYRGVGMTILTYALGNAWIAALLCAAAFALAHALQGWKSAVVIFAIALVMHALVGFTQTLLLAMGVHILYDLGAGYLIAQEARGFASEEAKAPDG